MNDKLQKVRKEAAVASSRYPLVTCQECDRPNLLQFSMEAMVLFSYFGRVTGLFVGHI
jgi:hypothetical protein